MAAGNVTRGGSADWRPRPVFVDGQPRSIAGRAGVGNGVIEADGAGVTQVGVRRGRSGTAGRGHLGEALVCPEQDQRG
jgi:hypothetical protein